MTAVLSVHVNVNDPEPRVIGATGMPHAIAHPANPPAPDWDCDTTVHVVPVVSDRPFTVTPLTSRNAHEATINSPAWIVPDPGHCAVFDVDDDPLMFVERDATSGAVAAVPNPRARSTCYRSSNSMYPRTFTVVPLVGLVTRTATASPRFDSISPPSGNCTITVPWFGVM